MEPCARRVSGHTHTERSGHTAGRFSPEEPTEMVMMPEYIPPAPVVDLGKLLTAVLLPAGPFQYAYVARNTCWPLLNLLFEGRFSSGQHSYLASIRHVMVWS